MDDSSFYQVPPVLAIKALISQVFGNVIENAIKYSSDKTQITIGGAYLKPTDAVTITISNEGIPITSDDAARIFDRGYRSRQAIDKYPAGTGFGLYIAKKIIDIHEGLIGVSTDGRKRTIFTVTLFANKLTGKAKQWPRKPSS